MLKSRLLILIVFSAVLHAVFSFFVCPVFRSEKAANFLYSWGQVHEVERRDSGPESGEFLNKKLDYNEFLLPLDKQAPVDFEKVARVRGFSKDLPSFIINKTLSKNRESYLICLGSSNSPIEPRFFPRLEEDDSFYRIFRKDRVNVEILVSPTGRAIWVQEFGFYSDVALRFDLDDWIRSLVFPAQKTYYWKNMEIVLK
ncbi:MAG: hypothetical protein JW734_03255 [Candidatus Omnitrophica bacterium]|nr:hypothetical protein [Candidatus Omnitrophota bacterium]